MAGFRLPSLILSLLLAAPALCQAPPADDGGETEIIVKGQKVKVKPLVGGQDFISPMGQPFHSTDRLSGAELWFRDTDTDHDGRITKLELRAEAARFFETLDTDHDGEIGPNEISHYEQVIAPEIMVLSTYGDVTKATVDSDGKLVDPPYPNRLGAGRYSYLSMPEPVTYADTNMDRGVSKDEFQAAADKRFRMLDLNGDGLLTRDELPKLQAVHDR